MSVYAKTSMETMPGSCTECSFGRRYGCVGDVECRILREYFTGNVEPPYKERPDECPLVEAGEPKGVATMNIVPGSSIGFLSCPHCGKETEFYIHGSKAHIICSDHNCWGGMSVQWGTRDEPYRFIEKMKASWNQRTPDGYGIVAAKRYIEKYCNEIYQDTQREYSDHCRLCVEVLDEVLNKLECFMPSGGRPVDSEKGERG